MSSFSERDWLLVGLEVAGIVAEVGVFYAIWSEGLSGRKELAESRERIRLNVEVVHPDQNRMNLYGIDDLIRKNVDIIDRAKFPGKYRHIGAGNEVLIVGPEQSGKKAFAFHMARLADIQRVVVVHNPRDADALAYAKKILEDQPTTFQRCARAVTWPLRRKAEPKKTMLLLPGLDPAYGQGGEVWCDQLEALIETASQLSHVLIVGTAKKYERNTELGGWFGTVVSFPGPGQEEWKVRIKKIAEGILNAATQKPQDGSQEKPRYELREIEAEAFIDRILKANPTPAEIRDIFAHCMTLATHQQTAYVESPGGLTSEILDIAINRVIPNPVRSDPVPPNAGVAPAA